MESWLLCTYWKVSRVVSVQPIISAWIRRDAWLSGFFKMVGSQWFVVILDMHLPPVCILVQTIKPMADSIDSVSFQFVPISAPLG